MYILKTHWYRDNWCVFLKFGKEDVMERVYIAIDLKSFYASVECVERESDPLTTNLVVADESRTAKTICLQFLLPSVLPQKACFVRKVHIS